MSKKINFLVTGYGSLVGQAIIKTIRKSKFNKSSKIFSTDYVENDYGQTLADQTFILPDIFKNKKLIYTWKKNLIYLLNNKKIHFMLIGIDFELEIISKFKKYFEDRSKCKIIINNYKIIKDITNKIKLQKILKKNKFFFIETTSINKLESNKIKFPLIVKKSRSTSSKDVFKIVSRKQLNKISEKNFIVQKFIPGIEYTCSISNYNNNTKNIIVLERLLKNGDSIKVKSNKQKYEWMNNYLLDVYKSLGFWGPINIQFKAFQNKIYIFEINPRYSGTTFMRSLFGYNEINILISHYFNIKHNPKIINGVVIRFYNEKKI